MASPTTGISGDVNRILHGFHARRLADLRSVPSLTFRVTKMRLGDWRFSRASRRSRCGATRGLQGATLESLIRTLFDVKGQIKDLNNIERLSRRQSLSAYVRRHREALGQFIFDARVPIDNNDCEQLMKRVATGRKAVFPMQ